MLTNKKGQSTLEYVILVTAVIVVIIVFLLGGDNALFQKQMNSSLNAATDGMETMAGRVVSTFGG